MTEYKSLITAILLILIIGGFSSAIASTFSLSVEEDTFLDNITSFMNEGFSLFGFTINIFAIFGDGVKEVLVNALIGLQIIPAVFLYPLIILILALLVLGVISLLPTT